MRTGTTSVSQSHVQMIGKDEYEKTLWFDEIASGIYDYAKEDGYRNLGTWILKSQPKKV